MIRKIAVWIFLFIMFNLVVVFPSLGYLLYNEPPPFVYSRREVLTPSVPPGGTLKIQISGDISKKCAASVERTIVDGKGIPFDLGEEPRDSRTDYTVEVPIPLGTAPGQSYYVAHIKWACNVVQQWFPQEVLQRRLRFMIEPTDGQIPIPEKQGIYQEPEQKSELAVVK